MCIPTQKVQITLWCLNYITVHKVKSSVHLHALHFSQNLQAFDLVLKIFSLRGGHTGASTVPFPQ